MEKIKEKTKEIPQYSVIISENSNAVTIFSHPEKLVAFDLALKLAGLPNNCTVNVVSPDGIEIVSL